MKRLKWCVKTKKGKIVSHHFTKKQAQKHQLKSGRAERYVKKC